MKQLRSLIFCLLAAALVVAGCDKKENNPTETPVAECNTLTHNAPSISDVQASGAMPSAQGGTFQDGLYFMTQHQKYSAGATLRTRRQALKIAGTNFEVVEATDNGAVSRSKYSVTTGANGAISFTVTCPNSGTFTLGYTVTSTGFVIYNTGEQNASTFTKQ